MKNFYFTTSWDDGSMHDIKLAALLDKYGIMGTFYIPKEFDGLGGKFSEYGRRLADEEIRLISKNHEIGSHSLTHRLFKEFNDDELRKEISGSKLFIEEFTSKGSKMFCAPRGFISDRIVEITKEAGFRGIRTTDKMNFTLPADSFQMGVSIQCAPFPFRKKDCGKLNFKKLLGPIKNYGLRLLSFPAIWPSIFSWESFAKASLKYAVNHGNYFHLYGHSWELEKYCLWGKLENLLKYASQIPQIEFLTNSEVVERISK